MHALPYLRFVDVYFVAAVFIALIMPLRESWWYFALGACIFSLYSFLGTASLLVIWGVAYAVIRLLQDRVFSDFSLYSTLIITMVASMTLHGLVVLASYARTFVIGAPYAILLTDEYARSMMMTIIGNMIAAAVVFIIAARVSKVLTKAFIRR